MKKLVLILLLTIPHVACGSELTDRQLYSQITQEKVVYEDAAKWEKEEVQLYRNISDHQRSVVVGSKLLTRVWFDNFEQAPYFIGLGPKYICIVAKKLSSPAYIAFSLFSKEGILVRNASLALGLINTPNEHQQESIGCSPKLQEPAEVCSRDLVRACGRTVKDIIPVRLDEKGEESLRVLLLVNMHSYLHGFDKEKKFLLPASSSIDTAADKVATSLFNDMRAFSSIGRRLALAHKE